MADAALLPADPASAFKRAQQGKSYWRRVWERLRDDKVTLAVIGVLVMLLVMVVFAPWFTVHDPYTGSVLRRLKPVGTPGHWLGTDEVGRDLWARMVYGGRLSLLAGVMPVDRKSTRLNSSHTVISYAVFCLKKKKKKKQSK